MPRTLSSFEENSATFRKHLIDHLLFQTPFGEWIDPPVAAGGILLVFVKWTERVHDFGPLTIFFGELFEIDDGRS